MMVVLYYRYLNQAGYECFGLSMVEHLSMMGVSVLLVRHCKYCELVLACACVSKKCGAQALRDLMLVIK